MTVSAVFCVDFREILKYECRMPIRILDDNTINKIAAGEVIERPASALKELLENAIDGGATKIEVTFEEGGKNLVRVSDNGKGIVAEELSLALQRHATSKIERVEDLFALSTMGFRGEALASIAAVSLLSISSTPTGSAKGAKVTVTGGNIGEIQPSAPLNGTQVEVKNLFYNVPARQKFLKSTGGETTALKKVFKNFALINSKVALTLKQDSKQTLFYPAQDFVKRCSDVLGVQSSDCFYLQTNLDGFEIEAVLVHPKLNLSTQIGIYVFVQERPVQDRLISQAIMEGYRNLVMDHQFPQAVVSLKVPKDFVDVNVHPAKLQVKFQSSSTVFRLVSSQIQKLLTEKLESSINPVSFGPGSLGASFYDKISPYEAHTQQELVRDTTIQYNQKTMVVPTYTVAPLLLDEDTVFPQIIPETLTDIFPAESQLASATHTPKISTSTWSGLQVIGQLANTYILTQSPKGLVMIDQHAAHERVLFERLKNQNKIEKQASLFEDLIELDSDQIEVITSPQWQEHFERWGFEFHQRGTNTLAITTRPAFLSDSGLKPLIERLSEQISENGSHGAIQEVIHDIWASMSCHGAIRAGKVMSNDEMKALLNQMEEYSFSSFCPHGRPVSVQLSLYDLEKLFKRIV